MTEDFITCDFPDLDAFIRELDLLDRNVNAALREGLHAGADIIRDEQRRRILTKPLSKGDGKRKYKRLRKGTLSKLAQGITTSKIYVNSKGALGVTVGYQANAFKPDADGLNVGLTGMVTEFGRPGQSSSHRRKLTMTQTRNGKKHEVEKGSIQPYPHIRSGFDAAVRQASQEVINKYNQVIDKLGE